jgi:uncharacterized protein (TIGR02246 family)
MDEIADSKVISQIAVSLMDARNRFDSARFASFYADDAEFTNVQGKLTRGKDELERSLKRFYSTAFVQKTRQVIEGTNIKFIDERVASLDIRWRTEGAIDPAGQPRRGIVNAILVKDSTENWKVVVSHNMQLTEAATSALSEKQ